MSNTEKYNAVFMETFRVAADQLSALAFQYTPQWDSVGHLQLIVALEDAFGIMLDPDDILDLSSYEKGKEYLGKYGIKF